MDIVIFSTKLNEKGLFGGSVEPRNTRALSLFFLNNQIESCLSVANSKDELKKLLLEYCEKHSEELESKATAEDKEQWKRLMKRDKDTFLSSVISSRITKEINDGSVKDLLDRIKEWDLQDSVLRIGKADRSVLKKIRNQQVYAIRCLEDSDPSMQWISSLMGCVEDIKGEVEDNVNLFLVLHDKDVKKYDGKNAYVCGDEEVNTLVEQGKFPKVKVQIAFFSHTANKFVDILDNSAERDILPEVEYAFNYYREFQKLIERSDNCLNNMMGQNPSTIIQNEDELVTSSVNNPRLADDSAEQGAYEVKVTTLSTEIGGNEVKTNDWLKELIKINKELEEYE